MSSRFTAARRAALLLACAACTLAGHAARAADEPKEVATLKDYTGYPYGVAFSPDSKTLAWCCTDKAVRQWDVAAGKERAKLEHKVKLDAIAFSPDGKTL